MALQIFPSTGGTASFNGIFIPRDNLVAGGLADDAEFADAVSAAIKRDKALYATLYIITDELNQLDAQDRLGVTPTVPNLNATASVFSLVTQRYIKENADAKLAPIPVPTAGTFLGRGDVAFTAIFPDAVKVASAASVTEAGILIETAPLVAYGSPAHASLNLGNDSRDVLYSIMKWVATDTTSIPTRSTTEASAITARSVGTSSEIAIPAAYIAGTNPTSGLDPADANITHILSSGTVSITIDTAKVIDGSGVQSWEVNTVTA